MSEPCAGTGLWHGAGCSFQGFQVQGASVCISCGRQGAAKVTGHQGQVLAGIFVLTNTISHGRALVAYE